MDAWISLFSALPPIGFLVYIGYALFKFLKSQDATDVRLERIACALEFLAFKEVIPGDKADKIDLPADSDSVDV